MRKKVFLIGLIGLLLMAGIFGIVRWGGTEIEKEPVTRPVVTKPVVEKPVPVPTPTPTPAPPTEELPVVKEEKPEPPAPDSSVIKISAEKLYSEYQANPAAATLKYRGKIVEVTGVIGRISNGTFPTVHLIGDEVEAKHRGYFLIGVISCPLPLKEIALLSKGQTITVRGKFVLSINIVILDARIIE